MKKIQTIREIISAEKIIFNEDYLTALASNCFEYSNTPENCYIDWNKVNTWLTTRGRVAYFYDEIMEQYICLPFNTQKQVDMYGNPTTIDVFSYNGKYRRRLTKDEYVVIYDNTLKISLMPLISYTAERMGLCDRIIDFNIFQQKNPRVFSIPQGQEQTFTNMINSIDSFAENITTYDTIDFEQVVTTLEPVPLVADDIFELKTKIFATFLHQIGVASVVDTKRERMIKDEIYFSQGGAFLGRKARENAREKAFKEINKKWGLDIKCNFYDYQELEDVNLETHEYERGEL